MANIFIRIFVTLGIVLGAYMLSAKLIEAKKPKKSKVPVVVIPVVDTKEVTKGVHQPAVMSFGTVQSYDETVLIPQVSGRVLSVSENFRVGETVHKGEVVVVIDDTDFQAELAGEKANLILQQSALAEEEVRSEQAAADWTASGRSLADASDFVLRKPQMLAALANIQSVEVAMKIAETNIKRAKIVVPYDAIVTERTTSVGGLANPQTSLGRLVATAKAEVRIPLTAEQKARVKFSKDVKTMVTLKMPSDESIVWKAELSRVEPTLDPLNQVSYIIATVNDPYGLESDDATELSVGSFVNVVLPAIEISDAYEVPEAALVNDQFVWVVNEESRLRKVRAKRLQSSDGLAYIQIEEEFAAPIRVVTRPLSTFRSELEVSWEVATKK